MQKLGGQSISDPWWKCWRGLVPFLPVHPRFVITDKSYHWQKLEGTKAL